ncbi:Uncharacterized protein DAT39_010158 [Clarias magur]|uniref:Uncharacterized protein n=1 Tax=Clarias magur TaxID=1594786 RepID=A0A8J4UHF0_CLAMG|nr:Uncharacterized protein DAT39_010158 [Clarias magur]
MAGTPLNIAEILKQKLFPITYMMERFPARSTFTRDRRFNTEDVGDGDAGGHVRLLLLQSLFL